MKYKIGFRLDWLEMIIVLTCVFFSGVALGSDLNEKYIYIGLALTSAGGLLIKKRVKIPLSDKK